MRVRDIQTGWLLLGLLSSMVLSSCALFEPQPVNPNPAGTNTDPAPAATNSGNKSMLPAIDDSAEVNLHSKSDTASGDRIHTEGQPHEQPAVSEKPGATPVVIERPANTSKAIDPERAAAESVLTDAQVLEQARSIKECFASFQTALFDRDVDAFLACVSRRSVEQFADTAELALRFRSQGRIALEGQGLFKAVVAYGLARDYDSNALQVMDAISTMRWAMEKGYLRDANPLGEIPHSVRVEPYIAQMSTSLQPEILNITFQREGEFTSQYQGWRIDSDTLINAAYNRIRAQVKASGESDFIVGTERFLLQGSSATRSSVEPEKKLPSPDLLREHFSRFRRATMAQGLRRLHMIDAESVAWFRQLHQHAIRADAATLQLLPARSLFLVLQGRHLLSASELAAMQHDEFFLYLNDHGHYSPFRSGQLDEHGFQADETSARFIPLTPQGDTVMFVKENSEWQIALRRMELATSERIANAANEVGVTIADAVINRLAATMPETGAAQWRALLQGPEQRSAESLALTDDQFAVRNTVLRYIRSGRCGDAGTCYQLLAEDTIQHYREVLELARSLDDMALLDTSKRDFVKAGQALILRMRFKWPVLAAMTVEQAAKAILGEWTQFQGARFAYGPGEIVVEGDTAQVAEARFGMTAFTLVREGGTWKLQERPHFALVNHMLTNTTGDAASLLATLKDLCEDPSEHASLVYRPAGMSRDGDSAGGR